MYIEGFIIPSEIFVYQCMCHFDTRILLSAIYYIHFKQKQ